VSEQVLATAGFVIPRWRRAVLKISGEAFASASSEETIDAPTVRRIAREIAKCSSELGVELAVMIGGGNIWRGQTGAGEGMDRANSDTMGMLGTVINALALQDAIEREGQDTRVLSAIAMSQVCEPYIRRRAIRHLEKGRVVIFAAGMGNPFFTTDTPAALRAAEIEAEAVLKGTHSGVDGVYSADPRLDPAATRYDEIKFMDVITRDLRVMDLTAITFCRDNGLPILVFDLMTPGNIRGALEGKPIGTLIS
jgi:uridylate kinase